MELTRTFLEKWVLENIEKEDSSPSPKDLELSPSSVAKNASSGQQFINKFFLPLKRATITGIRRSLTILQKTGKLDVGQQNLFSYNKYDQELLAATPRSKGTTDAMSINNGLRNVLSMPDN